ncbi:MAG TPA: IS630 family transposase [Ktedonobacteraceae bacterium]|jgi:hypothetical protein|nr:IS630 family transposase [Ktedonobacteraceae bacterium]
MRALRVRDGKELTRCAASRNSKGYIALLSDIEADNPKGDLFVITDKPSQSSKRRDQRLAGRAFAHPPDLHSHWGVLAQFTRGLVGVCGRLFRRDALSGQSFANHSEIDQARSVATAQLNARAEPWVWGRPPKTPRHRRWLFSYRI